jgi:hypothetical protein
MRRECAVFASASGNDYIVASIILAMPVEQINKSFFPELPVNLAFLCLMVPTSITASVFTKPDGRFRFVASMLEFDR